ncbi:MAG: ABC transporter ATP-binding protein, partial [Betaproteobacteria bacterium]
SQASHPSDASQAAGDMTAMSSTPDAFGTVPQGATPMAKPKKLSFKEQRELEQLPQLIEQLENEQNAITARLADPSLYRQAPSEAQQLNQRYAEIDTLLLQALERWEAIASRAPSN